MFISLYHYIYTLHVYLILRHRMVESKEELKKKQRLTRLVDLQQQTVVVPPCECTSLTNTQPVVCRRHHLPPQCVHRHVADITPTVTVVWETPASQKYQSPRQRRSRFPVRPGCTDNLFISILTSDLCLPLTHIRATGCCCRCLPRARIKDSLLWAVGKKKEAYREVLCLGFLPRTGLGLFCLSKSHAVPTVGRIASLLPPRAVSPRCG